MSENRYENPGVFPMGKELPDQFGKYGAAADSWFSHLAIEVSGEETSAEWLEAVTDENYSKLG